MNEAAEPALFDEDALEWRQITREDYALIRPTMRAILDKECFYTLPANASDEQCMEYWFEGKECENWALMEGEKFLGSYYLRKNQYELGEHVANGGFMIDECERGKGIGNKLCKHHIERAKARGFKGIQFNFVVSTNRSALALWKKNGWKVIGTIPNGYYEKHEHYVDAHIMYKDLSQ